MKKSLKIVLMLCFIGNLVYAQKPEEDKIKIKTVLDSWHKAAADADFESYFEKMTSDAIFIGTDATENWKLDEFMAFAKPYFDRGKAWSFSAVERNIYLGTSSSNIAWFDELLNTQMELCRGSGVMKKVNGTWKIAHYVLSIAIPNENVPEIVALKKNRDSIIKSALPRY